MAEEFTCFCGWTGARHTRLSDHVRRKHADIVVDDDTPLRVLRVLWQAGLLELGDAFPGANVRVASPRHHDTEGERSPDGDADRGKTDCTPES